jgi:hypothetical protein
MILATITNGYSKKTEKIKINIMGPAEGRAKARRASLLKLKLLLLSKV